MLDAAPQDAADRSPRSRVGVLATSRRRALAASAIVALLLHGGFIGGIGGQDVGTPVAQAAAPVSVRTIVAAAEPASRTLAAADERAAAPPEPASPAPVAKPKVVLRPRQPTEPMPKFDAASERAGARIDDAVSTPPVEIAASVPTAMPAAVEAASTASTTSGSPELPAGVELGLVAASSAAPSGEAPSLLAAGEQPPPLYRTRLPRSATLRYQVRRGLLRGTGEIRWQASGETYRLSLEARIAGLTLLIQTSEGTTDPNGLKPNRFVDQRARRPAQAANFRRDIDRITFSGPAVEWPLLPGSEDRLSWMIQLAGIAAAEPGLLVEGGMITMIVVGARGEAGVWALRFAGREDVETAWGTVHAVKLVREGHSIYDTNAEIWLDPERDYLPAHATMRNSAGEAEYDLLLERIEPAS